MFTTRHYFPITVVFKHCNFKLLGQKSNVFQKLFNGRFKYTKNVGVKGIKSRNFNETLPDNNHLKNEEIIIEDNEYDSIANTAMNLFRSSKAEQNVLVIQPYIKWGPKKKDTTPQSQLMEAEALIRSLPFWRVGYSLKIPLESLEKKQLFGKGKLEELKMLLKDINSSGNRITCLFISKGTLSFQQKNLLEDEFKMPVMDRYSIVIQILRLHATSTEAKLQVAMAEIPYIWGKHKESNYSISRKQGFYLSDLQKEMLRKRENKLKLELEKVRSHRKLLRNKRKQKEFPIVAVIGYTNSGKTSLIKALTNEEKIQPKNQLFATLDVTAHGGFLPCKLQVIYMDTVGFMSDIPTGLIECFVATLEDAITADVIIHVQDLSHENILQQKLHVENTLKSLMFEIDENFSSSSLDNIINVGNKFDLVHQVPENLDKGLKFVSSTTFSGITDLLQELEDRILKVTNRKKITVRIKNGGEEMAWLYKNSAVTNTRADPNNEDRLLMDIIISNSNFEIFKYNFIK